MLTTVTLYLDYKYKTNINSSFTKLKQNVEVYALTTITLYLGHKYIINIDSGMHRIKVEKVHD